MYQILENTKNYLAKLLSTLGQSDCTVTNTGDFIKRQRYKMISFDVKSLFTNVPLEETIAVILKKVSDKSKIMTNIPRKTMRQLLLLCSFYIY